MTSSRTCWRRRQLPHGLVTRKLRGSWRELVSSF